MEGRNVEQQLLAVPMTAVVDAKDVHDKSNSDTRSYGSMKSMAFSIGWMRSVLRKPQTSLKWTAADNMWVDGGTKEMDLTHLRRILRDGCWSITYNPDFVKQVTKARSSKPMKQMACAELPGERVSGDDPMLPHLMALGEKKGWHFKGGVGIQVAFNAKSFRTPEPRFSAADLPYRTSFGRVSTPNGEVLWTRLEKGTVYSREVNQHALIGTTIPILISMFHSEAHVNTIHDQEKIRTDDKACS